VDASYRFGIEEEYCLADAATRGTPRRSVKQPVDKVAQHLVGHI
jgi:glutamate---cysteine ligase / carboxylate-amine ligase